jgi:hypothetical protein
VENLNHQILKMKIFSVILDKNKSELVPIIVQVEGKNKTDWKELKKYYSIITKN